MPHGKKSSLANIKTKTIQICKKIKYKYKKFCLANTNTKTVQIFKNRIQIDIEKLPLGKKSYLANTNTVQIFKNRKQIQIDIEKLPLGKQSCLAVSPIVGGTSCHQITETTLLLFSLHKNYVMLWVCFAAQL